MSRLKVSRGPKQRVSGVSSPQYETVQRCAQEKDIRNPPSRTSKSEWPTRGGPKSKTGGDESASESTRAHHEDSTRVDLTPRAEDTSQGGREQAAGSQGSEGACRRRHGSAPITSSSSREGNGVGPAGECRLKVSRRPEQRVSGAPAKIPCKSINHSRGVVRCNGRAKRLTSQ